MGEMMNGQTPGDMASDSRTQVSDVEVPTDVEGVVANGTKDGLHVFDVSKEDFYRSMKDDRKRQRFNSDSSAAKYLRSTRYKNSFYVRYKDEDGSAYIRKVK